MFLFCDLSAWCKLLMFTAGHPDLDYKPWSGRESRGLAWPYLVWRCQGEKEFLQLGRNLR